MNKTISIIDLRLDQKIDSVPFSLKELEKKVSRQGKSYLNINLGDKTGDIRGKVWNEAIRSVDNSVAIGDIVSVTATVQEYAGKPQLIITKLEKVEDMAPEEFLPITSRDRSAMIKEFEEVITGMKNPYLKKLLELFWKNEGNRDKYVNFPAGEYVHHGYIGGLIEHTWEMWRLSQPYFELYPQLDRDIFFTGLFFHDIGKLEELDIVGATIVRTKAGRLVAHIGQGIVFVDGLVQQVKDFPEDLKIKLYHLILSHQGQIEYGSPVLPQTLEALVLSFVDANSADMNQATKHIESELGTGRDFTGYHKWLRRSLYQGDYVQPPSRNRNKA